MTFWQLLEKATAYWNSNLSTYHLTEEDLLSVCINDDKFTFTPIFWEEPDQRYNMDLIEKFEREGYLIRSDKTDHPEIMNAEYTYLVIK